MSKWSEEAKQRRIAIKEYRIGEAVEAVGEIFHETGCCNPGPGKCLAKRALVPMVVARCEAGRHQHGAYLAPAIENRPVPPVNTVFVLRNWPSITDGLAKSRRYPVWVSRQGNKYRLGTVQEYQDQQGAFRAGVDGLVEKHNERGGYIRKAGLPTDDLEVGLLQPPGREDQKQTP